MHLLQLDTRSLCNGIFNNNQSSSWTGSTTRVRIRKIGTTAIVDTIVCSITDATAGKCAMVFTNSTFTEAGFYEGEIEITKSDGNIQTVNDLIKFNVRDDFD